MTRIEAYQNVIENSMEKLRPQPQLQIINE